MSQCHDLYEWVDEVEEPSVVEPELQCHDPYQDWSSTPPTEARHGNRAHRQRVPARSGRRLQRRSPTTRPLSRRRV